MCMFNWRVKYVRQTRILVAKTRHGRQLTIYENSVKGYKSNTKNNAMILPFPKITDEEVELIDLSEHKHLFSKLLQCFPPKRSEKASNKSSKGDSSSECDEEELEVHEVGAYNVSMAYSLKDLKRAKKDVFKLSPHLGELLKDKYSGNWGFVLCIFDPTKEVEAHPIGYVHDLLDPNHLFVPTRHEHGVGDGSNNEESDETSDETSDEDAEPLYSFDHEIYSLNTTSMKSVLSKGAGNASKYPEKCEKVLYIKPLKKHLPKWNDSAVLRRLALKGKYVNQDVILDLPTENALVVV